MTVDCLIIIVEYVLVYTRLYYRFIGTTQYTSTCDF